HDVFQRAAGGGKTVGLILEPLRHAGRVANFTAVFFRRTTPQITNPGGLWDESRKFYPRLGGTPHLGTREWRWPRGGKIKFAHLQFDSTVYDWQGAQIALLCFDELTHFTAHQFFYMVSGVVHAEEIICYRFDTAAGRLANLWNAGNNMMISVYDVGEGRTS